MATGGSIPAESFRGRFPTRTLDDFICRRCRQVFEFPVEVDCPDKHHFCENCVKDEVAANGRSVCEECHEPFYSYTKPSVFFMNAYRRLEVHCVNKDRGCTLKVSIEESKKHDRECGFNVLDHPLKFVEHVGDKFLAEIAGALDSVASLHQAIDERKRELHNQERLKREFVQLRSITRTIYRELKDLELCKLVFQKDLQGFTIAGSNWAKTLREVKTFRADLLNEFRQFSHPFPRTIAVELRNVLLESGASDELVRGLLQNMTRDAYEPLFHDAYRCRVIQYEGTQVGLHIVLSWENPPGAVPSPGVVFISKEDTLRGCIRAQEEGAYPRIRGPFVRRADPIRQRSWLPVARSEDPRGRNVSRTVQNRAGNASC